MAQNVNELLYGFYFTSTEITYCFDVGASLWNGTSNWFGVPEIDFGSISKNELSTSEQWSTPILESRI